MVRGSRSLSLLWVCGSAVSLALPTVHASALAGPTVKFVLADGAKISDTSTILAKVTPDGDVGIEKVEFAIDDQLKVSDQSTPYSFDWDTLQDAEGSHTVTATAFDAKGRTARASLRIVIDNELDKGAEAHADAALESLKEGNSDKAMRYARRALKIAPSNYKAARALAGIYRSAGDLNRAVATLDKAEMPAREIEGRRELAALHIAKADESGSTEDFLTECAVAVDIWHKVNALVIEDAKKAGNGPETSIALGDAYFAAHDWTNAIRAYQAGGPVETAPREALGRQALALIRAGRIKDATSFVAQIKRAGRADDSLPVIESMLALIDHDLVKAREGVQEGVDNSSLPAMVARMYADLPLNKAQEAQDLADKAVKMAPGNADVQLAIAFSQRDAVDAHRSLIKALSIDPGLPEAYALHAYQIMLSREKNRYAAADAVLDYALKLDPKNTYVLMAKVVNLQAQRRPQEAEPMLAQLLEIDKKAPDVHVAQALNLSMLDRTLKITEELNTAFKLDPERWADVFIPKPNEFPLKVFRYRYQPVMNPSTLYATK